jgi:hypothetical protein
LLVPITPFTGRTPRHGVKKVKDIGAQVTLVRKNIPTSKNAGPCAKKRKANLSKAPTSENWNYEKKHKYVEARKYNPYAHPQEDTGDPRFFCAMQSKYIRTLFMPKR